MSVMGIGNRKEEKRLAASRVIALRVPNPEQTPAFVMYLGL
jgi:hypothetical protein